MPFKIQVPDWKAAATSLPSLFNATTLSQRTQARHWPASVQKQHTDTLIRHLARPLTCSLSQRLHHPREWPLAKRHESSAAKMGRAGYDTTNMKVAKNPRPAAASSSKSTKDASAEETKDNMTATEQQQQQQQPQRKPHPESAWMPKGPYPPGHYGNEALGFPVYKFPRLSDEVWELKKKDPKEENSKEMDCREDSSIPPLEDRG